MKTSANKRAASRRPPTGERDASAARAVQRAAAEIEAVTEMARAMGLGVDAADRYGRITDAARKILAFDRVTIARLDSEGRTIASLFDLSKEPSTADEGIGLPLDGTLAGAAIEAGSAVVDTDGQPSAISAPIVFRGVPAGAVTFESSRAGCYSQDDVPFVECVATLLAGAVGRENLEQALEKERRERLVLSKIGQVIGSSLELDDVFEEFADEVRRLLSVDRITVSSIDRAEDTRTIMCVSGVHVPGLEPGEVEQLSNSIAGEVGQNQRTAVLGAGGKQEPETRNATEAREFAAGIQSILVAPLVSRNEAIGILRIGSTRADAYSAADVTLAERIGAQIAGAIANSQLYFQSVQLSEERELRAQVDAENRELLRVNEEKSKFTSLVSHELRSPLTSMLAFADLLARNKEGTLTSRQMEFVEAVRRGGRAMNVLVDDLLNLSRIEAGTFKLERQEFDATGALQEHVRSFAPIAESKKQTVAVSLPEESNWVDADPDRFGQVISNLLSNASKYSPEESEIELDARTEGDRLHVAVRDHGIGISRADQRKLFTAFFRAGNKETRSEKGTGLGLCITKSLVEMHGGQISIESEPGTGTAVSFYIRGLLPGPSEARDDAGSLDGGAEGHAAQLAAG